MNVQPIIRQTRTLVRDASDLAMFVLALLLIVLMGVLALATLRDQTFWALLTVVALLSPLPVMRICQIVLRDE